MLQIERSELMISNIHQPQLLHANETPNSALTSPLFLYNLAKLQKSVIKYSKMVVSSLEGLSDAQKQELVASLSAIVVGSAGADVSADSLSAVATASGNSLSAAWASVFASAVSKVRDLLCFGLV